MQVMFFFSVFFLCAFCVRKLVEVHSSICIYIIDSFFHKNCLRDQCEDSTDAKIQR